MSSTNATQIHDALMDAGIAAGHSDVSKSNIYHLANLCAVPGDHVEIGTLHGASAIAVALAKKMAGVPGEVYCIDPLDGRPDNPRVNPLHVNANPSPDIVLATLCTNAFTISSGNSLRRCLSHKSIGAATVISSFEIIMLVSISLFIYLPH